MLVKFGDREFECTMGSDVQRDGMYLELSQLRDDIEHSVLEVFYSDAAATLTLTAFEPNVPIEAVEWLIGEAKKQLPPLAAR